MRSFNEARDPIRVRQAVLIGGTVLGLGIFGAATAHTPLTALFWISLSLGGLGGGRAGGMVDSFFDRAAGKCRNTGGNHQFL